MNFREFQKWVGERVAPPESEEGQEKIYEGRTHVTEMWEDGELTFTKSGDLYRARRLHQRLPPRLPHGFELFKVPEDREHTRMVVLDDEMADILEETRFILQGRSLEVEFPESVQPEGL